MFDSSTYHAWHGLVPMADYFRTVEPDRVLVEGAGSHVVDRAGRRYLDARSSMWNVTLGYSCEPVKEAMRRQADLLPSGTVMRYENPPEVSVRYASALAGALPGTLRHIRLGNTGSQMTESAVMLSRFHRRMTGEPGRTHVIALHGAYHGTGALPTALTADPVLHDYCAPLDSHVRHVTVPPRAGCDGAAAGDCGGRCVEPVLREVDELGPERVTAVLLEPVIGSYFLPVTTHYLDTLAAACRARGIHVIVDEVTTGAGRVGAMTVSESMAVEPDMIVLGKGLSAGYFPLAALAVCGRIYDALFAPEVRLGFPNGSTTDGHPIGAAVGLATLDVILADGFFDSVRATGRSLAALVTEALADLGCARAVHGLGLMLGVELADDDGTPWSVRDVYQLRLTCQEHGLLTSYADGILPLMPHLTMSAEDSAELAERLAAATRDFQKRRHG